MLTNNIKVFSKLQAVFLVIFILSAMFLVQIVAYQLFAYFNEVKIVDENVLDANLTAFTIWVTAVFMCVLTAAIIKLKKQSIKQYLQISKPSIKISFIFLGIWLVFVVLSEIVMYWLDYQPIDEMRELYKTANPQWLFWSVVILAAPIYEEVIFRGILWSAIAEQFKNKYTAIVVSALLTSLFFALIHLQYDVVGWVVIFFLALILSAARVYSGSILLPVGIHIVNNSMSMLQLVYSA